ncbi:MAG: hypothetical protein WBF38_05585 [Nitrosotalea sp.]
MKPKLLYAILIGVAGIVVTVASVNVVLAASLTVTGAQPSTGFAGTTANYVVQFTTATPGTIGKVVMVFPSGTVLPQGKVAIASGLGPGTSAVNGSGGTTPTLTYTVDSPASIPAGTRIGLLLQKFANAPTPGSTSLSVTTNDTSGIAIDGPTSITFGLGSISQGPFTLDNINNRVGINKVNPQQSLDVVGNVQLTGNLISNATSGSTLNIIPATNGAICIGTGC